MSAPFDVMTATIFYFSVQEHSIASVVGNRSERRVGSWTGAVQMSHADQLIEIATELAMDAKDDVADLHRKLSAIETAKVEIESRLQIANHALERLSSFVSMRGSDLQCPRCWITGEVIASLRPSSGNGDHDKFRCETCKSIFDLQI
jgi:hypothetical protein